jgi:hypothetical protein
MESFDSIKALQERARKYMGWRETVGWAIKYYIEQIAPEDPEAKIGKMLMDDFPNKSKRRK